MKRLIPMIAVAACAVTAFAEKSEKDTFNSSELSAWWINPSEDTKVDTVNNWLAIDTDKDHVVQRLYNDGRDLQGNPDPKKIPSNGMLYFDSKVKFTVSDSLSFEGGDDAKIGLWAYSKDEGEPTNLVVCAGVKNGTGIGKEIFLTTTEIEADTFYRVTVKAMPIGSEKYGFGIYVDGVPVVIDTTADTETFAVATGFELSDLNATAQSYEKINALFPSLIAGIGDDELTAVGFIGTGIVDDVDFTDVLPTDIPGDATTQAFAWTGNFKSITVETDGEEVFSLDLTGTSQNLEFKAGTETFTIEAVPADGYAIVGSTVGEKNVGATIAIEAYEIPFTVDGVPYKTFGDAVTAAISAGKPLVLAKSYSGDPLVIGGDLTLDLAGKTITTEDGDYAIVVNSDCQLTIMDSSEGSGCIEAGAEGAILAMGTVVIRGGKIAGPIEETATFFGGSVIKGTEEAFSYTLGDPDTLEAKEVEGYWVIGPKEAEKTPLQIFIADLADTTKDTVTLTDDITLDESIVIDRAVTVDLNEKEVTYAGSKAFGVTAAGVTIKNGTIVGPQGATAAALDGKAMVEVDGATASLTLTNVTITAGGEGSDGMYGVYVLNGGTLTVESADITSWFAAIGANNTTSPTTITVKDGTFTQQADGAGQWWSYFCAAIYAPGNGTLTIDGGTFNGALYAIASRYANVNQTITVNDGTFSDPLFIDNQTGDVPGDPIARVITKGASVELAAPEGYIWDNDTTLVAIQEVTPVVMIDDPIVKYVDGMQFPTVNVEDYTLTTDYTVAWTPNAITEPTAGTTNTYTATVTMTGKYTGTGTATLQVYKEAEEPTPVIDPVVPGAEITIPAGAVAEEFAETVEAQKDTLLKAPGEVATTDTYRSYFTAAVVGDKVEFVLNKDGEAAIQANANSEIVKIKPNEIAALTTEEGKFEVATTIPGFYYAVKQGNGIGNMKVVEEGVLAKDAEGVELTFKKYQGAGFYQIIVSEKPIPAAQ